MRQAVQPGADLVHDVKKGRAINPAITLPEFRLAQTFAQTLGRRQPVGVAAAARGQLLQGQRGLPGRSGALTKAVAGFIGE